MLLSTPADLSLRRREIAESRSLDKLLNRLGGFIDEIVLSSVEIPTVKAQLSRAGGVCSVDGNRLTFNGFDAKRHRCPACGRIESGELHYRAWVWRFHLWIGERILTAGLLSSLGGKDYQAWVRSMLTEYAGIYGNIPNRDNILGPTRLFFSTYLESIWLLQVTAACSSVDWRGEESNLARVLEMVDQSANLIRSFDEGWSNRQVWNNAALIAAGSLLENSTMIRSAVSGAHGIERQLSYSVDAAGRWHEGENYHLFALRGFQWAAEILRTDGVDLYSGKTGSVLREMHVAPWKLVMPDFTFPARADSPFAVSVMQPRFAELWEVGWARTKDSRLKEILGVLYGRDGLEDVDFGRDEIAEVETNRPASKLSREKLGWKSLLIMNADVSSPEGKSAPITSLYSTLDETGPVVLQGADRYRAMLECNGTGAAGHGHPDKLHMSLFWGQPWLNDFGTGSYVNESLHWYRSTLAHNAPGVAGLGQKRGVGWCVGVAGEGGWGWCKASAVDILGPASESDRTLVMGPDYLVDIVDVRVPNDVTVDLPVHLLGISVSGQSLSEYSGHLKGLPGAGKETGYGAVEVLGICDEHNVAWNCKNDGEELQLTIVPRDGEAVLALKGLGPPTMNMGDGLAVPFLLRRAQGTGRWVQVYSKEPGVVQSVESERDTIRIVGSKGIDVIRIKPEGADVEFEGGGVSFSGDGSRPKPEPVKRETKPVRTIDCVVLDDDLKPSELVDRVPWDSIPVLGRESYRRSEEEYQGEDMFSAQVFLGASAGKIVLAVRVKKPSLVLYDPTSPKTREDNESPDIHSDGVQWYVGLESWTGYVAVPGKDLGTVAVRAVAGMDGGPRVEGAWGKIDGGYWMVLQYPLDTKLQTGDEFLVDVVVNQMEPGRSRRAGQLTLSGNGGWVYLRGDRESSDNALTAVVQ